MIEQKVILTPVDGAKQQPATNTNGNGATTSILADATAATTKTQTPPPSSAADGGDEGGGGGGGKTPRLPRWTRQEILVLIEGKRVAENRVRRGRVAGPGLGSGQVEPKWASVSGYCKRHGVNRGPVQCRKRWSNLAGDYKKIKEWESQAKEGTESFWVMRNDLRRERKLPGFFDKEVYDILDGGDDAAASAAAVRAADAEEEEAAVRTTEEGEAVFDSGRSAAAEEGLFSDFEMDDNGGGDEAEVTVVKEATPIKMAEIGGVVTPIPTSGKQFREPPLVFQEQGTATEKHPASNPETGSASQEGRKRKRYAVDGDDDITSLQDHLIDVLERNGKMLSAQLEAQNANFQLDREQRKDHTDSLVAVLNKLADALGRIADKL